jgi:mono/diheme cytochrome c family protein
MDMGPAEARKLAKQSQEALLGRLHNGGLDMPAFPQLSEPEIHSLVAYLRQLADVPNAAAQQITIEESPERIGEHIVKSTCHVCHGASGPNPGPWQLAQGAIPPLSTLTSRVNKTRFIQKVTRGAPIAMGNPAITCRGRMPVFDYLSAGEAADAYLYLTRYPPYQLPIQQPTIAVAAAEPALPNPDPPQDIRKPSLLRQNGPKQIGERADMQLLALLTVAGVLVSVLLGGALAFSIWECMRLRGSKTPAKLWHEVESPVRVTAAERVQDRLSA